MTCLLLTALAVALDHTALAQESSVTVVGFRVFALDDPSGHPAGIFNWPETEKLGARIMLYVNTANEQQLNVFLVVRDGNNKVVGKHKQNDALHAGEHALVFEDIMETVGVFGEAEFSVTLELEGKGIEPITARMTFLMQGPPLPEVKFGELRISNPLGSRGDQYFAAGDEFVFEGDFAITGNESGMAPRLIVYAAMEEDSFLLDPFYQSQTFTNHWDSRELTFAEGPGSFSVRGRLPFYFAEPYEYVHPFRIYAIISFGPEAQQMAYAQAELSDNTAGEERQSDEVLDRLIELARSAEWRVGRSSEKPAKDPIWD